jgi:solute carrier family 25 protein 14/30
MFGAAIANPTDLIKVRFQAKARISQTTLIQTAMDIINNEGWKGLYRGVIPTTQRAIILTATQLPTWDFINLVMITRKKSFWRQITSKRAS